MSWIALKMLMGDRAKYLGIIAGVTFAALLIAQQGSIFCGLLLRTTSQVQDIADADIWVMDPNVEYIDEIKPLLETDLYRVQSVPGVAWAVRFYKGQGRIKLHAGEGRTPDQPADDTMYQQAIVLGLDDATLVGAPETILHGTLADLRQPDAVIMDEAGWRYLWPGEPFEKGRVLEMNDHRAVIVGMCKSRPTFQTFPILYTRYHQALQYVPQERKVMSFVLAAPAPGLSARTVCDNIEKWTGRRARTRQEFIQDTISYYMRRTGIPINFGITVSLGFIVGCAIAGQTFYTFTLENLNQFGALKAMGVTNLRIVGMVLLQALVVGAIGYGLGVGLAALFGEVAGRSDQLAFYMPWQLLVGTAGAVLVIVLLSSVMCIRKVLILEPAVVFRA
jgi:putative ABC transport system permease protein